MALQLRYSQQCEGRIGTSEPMGMLDRHGGASVSPVLGKLSWNAPQANGLARLALLVSFKFS